MKNKIIWIIVFLSILPLALSSSYQQYYHWYDNCQLNNAGGAISADDLVTDHGYKNISGNATTYVTHGTETVMNMSINTQGVTALTYNITERLIGDNNSFRITMDIKEIFSVPNFRFNIEFYNGSWLPTTLFGIVFVQTGGENKILINADTAPCSDKDTGARFGVGNASEIQITLNDENLSLYINRTLISNCTLSSSNKKNPESVRFSVSDGEVFIRNISIFNGSSLPLPPPTDEQPPEVLIDYPSSGFRFNNDSFLTKVNGTVTVLNGVVNYTWINDSRFNNTGNNSNFNFTPNTQLNDSRFDVMVLANNSLDEVMNTTISFIFDDTPPIIESIMTLNHSLFYAYDNITLQINLTDDNSVFFFNVSDTEGYSFDKTGIDTLKYIYNVSFNASDYGVGIHNLSVIWCDSTISGGEELNCDNRTYSYYIFNYTASYTAVALETVKDLFTLIIDFKDIIVGGNGSINYDGTDYVITQNYTSVNQLNLSINLTIPQVTGNDTNITLYWDFNLNGSLFTTKNYSQQVDRVSLSTCGDQTQVVTLNISVFDEDEPPTYLLTDIDAVFTTWTNDSSNTLNFSFDLDGKASYTICIYPNTTLHTNAYFLYNTSGGFTQRWYLSGASLTVNESFANLYNYNITAGISDLRGTLRGTDYQYFPLVTTKLQRYYVTEDAWRTVQMDRSDDFGQVLFHIKEESTDYRLIFERSGTEIDRTNSMKFICTSSVCTLIFIVEDVGIVTSPELTFSDGYDNNSETFQLNWSDGTGLTHSVRLVLTQERGTASTVICDTTISSSSGTINCDTSGFNGVLLARIYKSQSDEIPAYARFIEKIVDAFWEAAYIGTDEATWWALGFSTTLVMGGAVVGGPIGASVVYVFSLIFLSMFKLLSFATFGVISLVVVIVMVIAYLLNR